MPTALGSAPKIVFGAAAVGSRPPFDSDQGIATLFDVLEKHNITTLDTAQFYGSSEENLGLAKAGQRFTIDTKWLGGWVKGTATEEGIESSAQDSLRKIGVKKVDIFYLHAPDSSIPISVTLAGVNKVYQLGLFSRFGLSNFTPDQVREVHSHCTANGYVLPVVYQGNYSAVTRKPEKKLFPLLRELGISFYAYSPIAGGLLGKTPEQLLEGSGRFKDQVLGGMYKEMYLKPSYLKALDKWGELASEQGCKRAELAYRWVEYHSSLKRDMGDAMVMGASSVEQLHETMNGLNRGPLRESVVSGINEIWENVETDAPVDNYEWQQERSARGSSL